MYQSIGINLSKSLDTATKRIKIPAITQRNYYKSCNNCEDEILNFYKSDCDESDLNYDKNFDYLDEDESDIDNECNCGCDDNCMIEKLKNLDSKVIVGASIGALVGCVGLYILIRRK